MRVKVCGLTREEDAEAAARLGAWGLGFIFYPKSPRYVEPRAVKAILGRLEEKGLRPERCVGVFVNESAAHIRDVVRESGIDTVQLHGDEGPELFEALNELRLWKAFRLKGEEQFAQMRAFAANVEAFLFDAAVPGSYGGTGHRVDWDLLEKAPRDKLIIVSGGLGPDNAQEAYSRFQPWAIDLASGVEARPGIKDHTKLKHLFQTREIPMQGPDERGYYGRFGGRFVPETLFGPVKELEAAYRQHSQDPTFQAELRSILRNYVGRPTPLTYAKRLSDHLGGARIYLKREDLTHTGAHKINNAIGQVLLATKMGKRRVIAETGAGQHGVATATAAALFGLECVVYMGSVDMARQALNVRRMRLLGAKVEPVESGSKTLKDAVNEAMRDWVTNVRTTFYSLGSALGPHPYPEMVRDFHRIIGEEAREQIVQLCGRLPDELIACVGGGSNAIGLFYPFIDDKAVAMTGVEAGGHGIERGKHAARFAGGSLGVLHGALTYILQSPHGQIEDTHSISAGLDYPAVGPEHAFLHESGRAQYTFATDDEAREAFRLLARLEGIIPALESSHAIAYAIKRAPTLEQSQVLLINLSGRGDKDLEGEFA